MNNKIIARGQGEIRQEIQQSAKKCLEPLKVPEDIPGINFFYVGDFVLHHMKPVTKKFFDGNFTLSEFRKIIELLEKQEGVENWNDEKLSAFKEELDSIVFIPNWFHRTIHGKNFDITKFNSREALYKEMARILMEDFDTIKQLKLEGEEIRDWLKAIQELKNTVYVSPNDYEKLKKLLMEAYEIIVNNIKKKPVNLKGNTAINKRLVARELLLTAKELLADTKSDYVYDPDHKNKPKGGGWEKTEKGWTQKKEKRDLMGRTEETINKLQNVASNPKTNPQKLVELSLDRSWKVRQKAVENPSTPIEAVKNRLHDKNMFVRESAKNRLGYWT